MIELQRDLISRGYKKHVSGSYKTFHMTDTLFQKNITDEKGKKYYINLWYYAEGRHGCTNLPESIQAEVQFETDGVTHVTLNLGYCELWKDF